MTRPVDLSQIPVRDLHGIARCALHADHDSPIVRAFAALGELAKEELDRRRALPGRLPKRQHQHAPHKSARKRERRDAA